MSGDLMTRILLVVVALTASTYIFLRSRRRSQALDDAGQPDSVGYRISTILWGIAVIGSIVVLVSTFAGK